MVQATVGMVPRKACTAPCGIEACHIALLVTADRPAALCERIDLVACARVIIHIGRAASVVSIVDVDQAGE